MGIVYTSVPVGSLITLPVEQREPYYAGVVKLPMEARRMVFEQKSGTFVRGLTKSYGLGEEKSAIVAFTVLRVVIGEKTLAQLPSLLSTELKLPNDKAQRMAKEIEDDLLGPVMKELEEYWGKSPPSSRQSGTMARQGQGQENAGGAKNVLNLKEERRPPAPPPMPKISK